MEYRKSQNLTQIDLAERYGVSGPAIFKFEKGFVTPSLKLWLKIASNIGIPDKEAVLIWVKEKLPTRMKGLINETPSLDIDGLIDTLEQLNKQPGNQDKMRETLLDNSDVAPALKNFIGNNDICSDNLCSNR